MNMTETEAIHEAYAELGGAPAATALTCTDVVCNLALKEFCISLRMPLEGGRSTDPPDDSADFLGSLAERVGLCMARLDKQLRLITANHYFHSRFGQRRDDLRGRSLFEFLHPKDRSRLCYKFGCLAKGRRTWFAERVVVMNPGVSVFDGELTCLSARSRISGDPGIIVLIKVESAQPIRSREIERRKLLPELSARVLEHIAVGDSTSEIASKLRLSRQGVDYHIGAMFRRFDVPNRAALVSRAFADGVLTGETWPPRVLIEFIK